MATTKKRLFISESHGNSNQCTPYRGKPDQHDTYASHDSPHTPGICFLWMVPIRGNLSGRPNKAGQVHCSQENALRLQHSARLSDSWDPPQFLSQHSHWSSALKLDIYWQQATRLTGPISSACDWYVQYFLTGTNPSVLKRHRRELPDGKTSE
jgi:hypothetical protein